MAIHLRITLLLLVLLSVAGYLLLSGSHAQSTAQGGVVEAPAATPAETSGVEPAEVVFQDPLDDSPLDVPLPEGDDLTDAVAEFHTTGIDPYDGDADASAAGKKLYDKWCQACHMPDGSGRIGPSLIDDVHNHERTGTDLGMFEMVWAGGAGAMQSFATRLTQEEILQVIAHINNLRKTAAAP